MKTAEQHNLPMCGKVETVEATAVPTFQTYKIQWHDPETDRGFRPEIWNDLPGEEWGTEAHAELRLNYWTTLGLPVEFRVQPT